MSGEGFTTPEGERGVSTWTLSMSGVVHGPVKKDISVFVVDMQYSETSILRPL